ncbi:GPI transamidase component PIG-T-like [Eurytemora carolleeae]|uniref:GPI transamidase component PIG-T-like n=1 Tax=Eurytemora carolleeae TaxID=1294199 RepID=UPI000C786C95|nr:GPI transamidase component PIG-T-like [Eurytemora carolleeae]|eukprot:XP_023323309.1 GPI transamidase component PIG-T-like [Eurytemora affinis]
MKFPDVFVFLALLAGSGANEQEKFTEELFIRQTSTGHIYSHFRFLTLWETDIRDADARAHFRLFPRTLGDILATFRVQELKLALTQGFWRTEKWGYPVESAPPGGMVVARFLPSVENVDEAWSGLTSSLAGLLCASLNKLDQREAIQPEYTFSNEGISGDGLSSNSSYLRYGLLPRENMCTENLTPWKKLLPCKTRRGLATLINSGHMQKYSSYQSIGLSIRPVCIDPACSTPSIELKQTMSVVFDPVIMNRKADNVNWSLKQMFGIGLTPSCPLSHTSTAFIDVTDAGYNLEPPPQKVLDFGGGKPRKIGVYDLKTFSEEGIRDIRAVYPKAHIYGVVRSLPVQVSRHVVGTGQERGGIVTTIKNTCSTPLTGVYLDLVPWYIRVYLHTLRVEVNGEKISPERVVYRPGQDRVKPYHLEMVLKLPPRSTTTITVETEYSVLRWTEYPPDANHGFYIGSAVLTTRLPQDSRSNATFTHRMDSSLNYIFWGNPETDSVLNIFTETLLVTMPTPDFSMPYNVICLACTVAALAFGPIHNITTRSLVLVPPEEEEKSLLGKLLAPLLSLFSSILGKTKSAKIDQPAESTESTEPTESKDK